jgi:hypothetical protein
MSERSESNGLSFAVLLTLGVFIQPTLINAILNLYSLHQSAFSKGQNALVDEGAAFEKSSLFDRNARQEH